MKMRKNMKIMARTIFLLLFSFCLAVGQGHAAEKPNILVIMGDDIGISNISAYSHGLMGYQTPNIDQLAEEGAMMTDYYGEQSCTAGRSAFITGQSPFRVGLTKVGMPGAKQGISDKDPTLATLLKPLGYTSGQFGKNHLGDPATNTCLPYMASMSTPACSTTLTRWKSRRTSITRKTRISSRSLVRAT
jgi:arylsulfatase A-like enzyme